MRVELLGWSSRGMRCPDVTVDLRRGGALPAISLIQMPNGTGKTTTLELVKAALSGSAQGWTPDYVREFRRPGETHRDGRFEVTLMLGGRPASWELTLNFETGTVRYKTSLPGSGGVVSRYERAPGMHDFQKPEFLNLFIFNGELAEELLDATESAAEKAVDALSQIYLLRDVRDFTHKYWEQESKRQTAKTETGLGRYEELKKQILKRQEMLERGRDEAGAHIAALEKDVERFEAAIQGRLADVETTRDAHARARDALADAETEVRGASTDLMSALRMPHALHPALGATLMELRSNLETLKLPEKASAQFFEELLAEPKCICGREMNHDAKACIKARSKDFLDAEESGVLNNLKGDVDRFVGSPDPDSGPTRVARLSERLRTALREERAADQQVRALKQQLIDGGDDELGAWQKARDAAVEKIDACTALLAQIKGPGDWEAEVAEITSLSALQKKLDDVESRIAEITKTVSLRNDTAAIQAILDRAEVQAREQIKAELIEACNARLAQVLRNDPLRIERIERSLRLVGQRAGSMGQTLAVGYTFLMSALNRGAHDFPLVVDSPALPMDAGVRRRTGRVIPDLCSQFVAFTLNVERAGFVDALEAATDDISYLTLFRKTPGTEALMRELPSIGVEETDSAVLVWDRDYFHRFDLEDEEEVADVVQAAE